jgi:hypothetical protein
MNAAPITVVFLLISSFEHATHAEHGDPVQLLLADGDEVVGTVAASDGDNVHLETNDGRRLVSIEQIRSMKRVVYRLAGFLGAAQVAHGFA